MKAFLYCESTDGGMVTHFYLEHQLDIFRAYLLGGLSVNMGPNDKAYRKAMGEDDLLLRVTSIMKVGDAVNHRIGVLIRLADDHSLVS